MHGYKKKLLDRYPEKSEKPQQESAPVSQLTPPKPERSSARSKTVSQEKAEPPKSVEDLRQAFVSELKKDEARFVQEKKDEKQEFIKKTAGFALVGLFSAGIGLWAGVSWMNAQLRPNWEHEISELQKQASLKLDRFLTSREVETLIQDKAREHGTAAAEKEVKNLVASAVNPAAAKIEAGAQRLNAEGDAVLAKLRGLSDFMLLELRAKNDDRKAFESLLAVSRDRSHEYREIASQAVSQIFILVTSLNVQDPTLGGSQETPPAAYLSLDQFKAAYAEAVSLNRPRLLSEFWTSKQFTEAQKEAFLIDVIRNDTSLRALAWACRLLDEKAKIYKPFTAYEKYLEWGAQNSLH